MHCLSNEGTEEWSKYSLSVLTCITLWESYSKTKICQLPKSLLNSLLMDSRNFMVQHSACEMNVIKNKPCELGYKTAGVIMLSLKYQAVHTTLWLKILPEEMEVIIEYLNVINYSSKWFYYFC